MPRPCLALGRAGGCPYGTYRSAAGDCREFNFFAVEDALRHDWSALAQLDDRVTTSDAVASAECALYHTWELLRRSGDLCHAKGEGIFGMALSHPEVGATSFTMHPERMHPLALSHAAVLAAMRNGSQRRDARSVKISPCFYGYSQAMDQSHMMPVLKSTYSSAHNASRAFLHAALGPGVLEEASPARAAHGPTRPMSSASSSETSGIADTLRREALRRDLSRDGGSALAHASVADVEKVAAVAASQLLFHDHSQGPGASAAGGTDDEPLTSSAKWRKEFEKFGAKVAGALFVSEAFHELSQEVLSVGYMATRFQVIRLLRQLIPESQMQRIVEATGYASATHEKGEATVPASCEPRGANTTAEAVDAGYDTLAQILFAVGGLVDAAVSLVRRIRHDECEMARHWQAHSGPRLVYEHLRLEAPVGSFVVSFPSSSAAGS